MGNQALKKITQYETERDAELSQGYAVDEYTDGVRIMDADESDAYFKRQALENAQAQSVEPLLGHILYAKLCKNNNIYIYVQLPDGSKDKVFLSIAEAQAFNIPIAITPIYKTSPKGVKVKAGYEISNTPEEINNMLKGKSCTISKIVLNFYTITEIW